MSRTALLSALLSCSVALPALAQAPRVVTDIAPVQGLVARVMEGVGTADVLVPPGASPHGYSLRPSDARALSSADLVVWVGHGLEPWLEGPLGQLATDATVIELLETPGTLTFDFRQEVLFAVDKAQDHDGHEDHEGHDHDAHGHDDHGHDDHDHEAHDHEPDDHDHGHADHDHSGVDPHAWLAPQNGKHWLALIAEALSDIDPANAEIYQSNALAGQAEIDAVTRELTKSLAGGTGEFVVFHDAYQYFENSFGLRALGAISLSDATTPSVARISAIRTAVADAGVTCVFAEPQFDPGLVETVTKGTELKALVIDPIGVGIAAGPQFYTELLAQTGAQFEACLTD
ncbi:zinc ABC transporter substrate-binding protein [Tritonibacter horizontis]|uniref:High-affinity zinc uptake system protein ZnuA n=1 Tax=Tritonibacter horizontis TaxID=1768241 RepID=A0A132BUD1_9RHOB|nr:zinc ABC transporter substrate-binding protein [Tritonibacter horizontis]KUP91904.1 high-affinity zinc uptake system protein ZnuA precursor [Tritonibacter horizontis]